MTRCAARRLLPATVAALAWLLPLAAPATAMAPVGPAEGVRAGDRAPTVTAGSVEATTQAPGRWTWPVPGRPPIAHPFQPPPAPWLPGHRGADLRAGPGTPVLAAGEGVVAFAGAVAGLPAVSVDHPGGLRTTYQPVVAVVRRGADVRRGQLLGRLSAAGSHCAPEACLHWGLRRGETYLDPLSLLGVDLRVRLLPIWGP
jgi:murein DD-endopeptidase MepM/ murein hydrolase activator NlpD